MDLFIKAGTNMSHQIAGQEVKGIDDILKISTIYLRYFRYFTDISSIFYRKSQPTCTWGTLSAKYHHFLIFR